MIKKMIQTFLHPTNRGLRLIVGLMLIALLVVHVSQTMATRDVREAKIQWSDTKTVVAQSKAQETQIQKIRRLANEDHVALLEYCKQLNADKINATYTCTFLKQERIRGQLGAEQQMDVKFRANPFSVAMHWTKNKPIGDAVLYVEGKYKNEDGYSQMLVRPTNKLFQRLTGGHVKRLPDSEEVMRKTLRPVTQFGLANSLQSLIDVYQDARQRGESREEVMPDLAEVDGRQCVVLVRYLPEREGYPAWKTLTFVDLEYGLPVRVMGWDWDKQLACNYEFHNVDFSQVLTDEDFTPSANEIRGAD